MIAAAAAGAIAVMSQGHSKTSACVSDCLSTPLELAIVIAFIVLGVAFIFFIPWLFIRKQ